MKSILRRPGLWLAIGLALIFLAHLRAGVGVLAWLAPIPLLRYLRTTDTWRSRVGFVLLMMLVWTFTTMKIVSGPLPLVAAVGFGIPIGLFQATGYVGSDVLRRRSATGAFFFFPAAMVAVEWAQHRFTPLASWGAAAYTQIDDTPLLQLASIFGMAGVSFVVYGFAAALEASLSARLDGTAPRTKHALALLAVVLGAHVYGAIRLDHLLGDRVKVAAIGTDATFDGHTMPSDEERARTVDHLVADTETAARAGAKLAVWTEAAVLVLPSEEPAFVDRIAKIAARHHVHVVAAYIVLESEKKLVFQNKLQSIRADGVVDHAYLKHHPVPGEPAITGVGPLTAIDTEVGRLGEAICYDYDFPSLAREHGAQGVDVVALPSSDWRGIDPIHTRMASLRAIEQGVSIIRSTRFGLTAGIDPLGRTIAQRSSWESDDRVLLFDVPRHGIDTFGRSLGDALVYACLALIVAAMLRGAARRARPTPIEVT